MKVKVPFIGKQVRCGRLQGIQLYARRGNAKMADGSISGRFMPIFMGPLAIAKSKAD